MGPDEGQPGAVALGRAVRDGVPPQRVLSGRGAPWDARPVAAGRLGGEAGIRVDLSNGRLLATTGRV